jgi:hypothetical protein
MLTKVNVLWTEFLYTQETQYDSLMHWWACLKRWWAWRPRIVLCAFCNRRMWENGEGQPTYCSPDCAYYDGVPREEEELPF